MIRLSVFVLLVAGCGGDAPPCPAFDTNNDCNPETAEVRIPFITPPIVHTGSNGRDTYQAVIRANFGDLSLESDCEDVACASRFGCVAPGDDGIVAVITAHSPGEADIIVRSGGLSERITVVVRDYSTSDYDLGDERYNNPANVNDTDRIACSSCHDGQGGAPHDPLALARYTDDELLAAVETSQYSGTCEDDDGDVCNCTPSGSDCSSCAGDCSFNEGAVLSLEVFGGGPGDHVYDLTADERVGIMAYMRAIRPEGI